MYALHGAHVANQCQRNLRSPRSCFCLVSLAALSAAYFLVSKVSTSVFILLSLLVTPLPRLQVIWPHPHFHQCDTSQSPNQAITLKDQAITLFDRPASSRHFPSATPAPSPDGSSADGAPAAPGGGRPRRARSARRGAVRCRCPSVAPRSESEGPANRRQERFRVLCWDRKQMEKCMKSIIGNRKPST